MDLQVIPIYEQTPEQVRMQDGQGTVSQGDGNHINEYSPDLVPCSLSWRGKIRGIKKKKKLRISESVKWGKTQAVNCKAWRSPLELSFIWFTGNDPIRQAVRCPFIKHVS